MNKRIDFSNLGGYPIAAEDFDWMQSSYRGAFIALAALIGSNSIVSGMLETGATVTNGWVSINNELIPFIGGTIGTGEFIIDETATPLVFDDGISRNVLFDKVARFSGGGAYNYAQLKRIGTLNQMWVTGDVKQVDCTNAYIAANFDVTGLGIGERKGWAICNGNNGTKDRRGLFSVGYDDRNVDPSNAIWDADYNAMGNVSGEKKHTLTPSEIPSLNVNIPRAGYAGIGGSGNLFVGTASSPNAGTQNVAVAGTGGLAHNNIPPFIVTLFIQKL